MRGAEGGGDVLSRGRGAAATDALGAGAVGRMDGGGGTAAFFGATGGGGTATRGFGTAFTGGRGTALAICGLVAFGTAGTFGGGGATRRVGFATTGGGGGAATRFTAGGLTTGRVVAGLAGALTADAAGFLMLGVGGTTVFRGFGIAARAGGRAGGATNLEAGVFACAPGALEPDANPCGNVS